MSAKSTRKGKRGEREAVAMLREIYPHAERGLAQCRDGGSGEPDIIGVPWHIEVGVGARVTPHAKLEQAARDTRGLPPLALTRRDRGRWVVSMYYDDWVALVRGAQRGRMMP